MPLRRRLGDVAMHLALMAAGDVGMSQDALRAHAETLREIAVALDAAEAVRAP